MVIELKKGLKLAKELYRDRAQRAREIKLEGQRVLGYFCLYPVLEMMTALDIVPYRILGNTEEPITKSDKCLPTIVCPFVRSALDLSLKGKYDFLDGVVMCHSCEVAEKSAHIWRTSLNPDYFHFIDAPHTIHRAAQLQFETQLRDFQKSLESMAGKKILSDKLKEAILAHNQQRALVREMYDLTKPDPPLISGSEIFQVMIALSGLPVSEGSELLRNVITEVRERRNRLRQRSARLLVWGSIIDDTALVEMIEGAGAHIVIDDTCAGSRAYFNDVSLTDDPMDGLAYRYLVDIKCPRTFREATYGETKKNHLLDMESRFGYLKDYASQWRVNGVILQSLRYCDIHGYEVPGLRDFLHHISLPNIYLEWDYSRAALAPLRTRVEAFLEVIG